MIRRLITSAFFVASLVASEQQSGANVIITYDRNDTITLNNVALSSLQPGNFTFVT